ncbi:hypothetical protein CC86DRAFT_49985 [Ophiobolus disseminans]|uniref:Uncharacterized protein n=1 Tax=Ophiobolus disseminans TaxID=1469910 RepID=A0A6A6ZVB0_9PLEO|nr:hypothetical protein CC86DRAFT_49985 [Ophiobolus disseminans]
MTSNGDPVLNASPLPGTPPPPPHKAASPSSKENRPLPQHGDHDHDDAQNESEAETVVLGSRGDDSPEKRVIKKERDDDDDNDSARLRAIKEESRAHSPLGNGHGRSSTSNGKEARVNGAKHGSDRDAKSPVPTSPSSRTTSRHTKDTSPTDSNKSPVASAHSPTQTTARGRSASTTENRKRKIRDVSFPKSIEPPRQKAKTEGLKEPRQPNSPATPGLGRPHKRSQSTQSILTDPTGRKRRGTTTLALSVEPTRWPDEDYSSENSYSPPAHTPNLLHTRLKRSSHRALTSPARTMVKPKVDRFGATRLARESEKGDLDAVKEAFDEAPDELDQVDYAGIAPLQKASLHGWADVVRYLIKQNCNTGCESNDRDTPLIDAVENGHLDVVKILLSEGHVNPHHSNKKGQRAIDVLDYEDDDADEIEKTLREAMRKETNTARTDKQPERKQAKTASRLLYNEYNVETLIEKAGDGDILAVGELINSNIKPNITCGVAAARGGHYDILSILLASGLKADPDPSKHPETPMTVAIGRGHLKIIQLLLEQDNFDPTRRNKENKAYYEIAEEKAGPRWEMEKEVLKRAYDEHKGLHRSPRRVKKEPPHLAAMRMKRNSLPKRDRSSSPRQEGKRALLKKSTTAPQKSRRLMSGKEMANREGKRRKRVVEDESSSEEESEEDVRPPTRKIKARSYSLGEENKPTQLPLSARSDENDTAKRKARARSIESGEDHGSKPQPKIRKRVEKPASAKPTPEVDSPDERKVVKNKIKYKTMEDKIKKRKLSDASADNRSVKKTPTLSAKSTPAPPERVATPEAERERRQEEQRLEIEARRKAAEAAAEAEKRRKEEEEVARQAAEEAEAKKRAEAEAEAQRKAEEAEAARKREEEEVRRRAEEETKRQEMLLARQDRISRLPRALRRACELGQNRPLHFSGEELGISAVFLPLFYATSEDLREPAASPSKTYVCSFQVVGILGLPELDLARLDAPYSNWPRLSVTSQQRDAILRQYDVALLAQDFRFPMEGAPDFNYAKIQESIKEAKNQFLAMEGLYWIEESLLHAEVEGSESLQPLLKDIKPECSRRRVHLAEVDDNAKLSQKQKPRKSFMDMVLAQNGPNGVHVNGDAG